MPLSQSQVHVGIMPMPKLNPSIENTDFQNSALYYEVTYKIIVQQDIRSFYTHGIPVTTNTNVIFHTNGNYVQEGGSFIMGYWDSATQA